MYTGAPNKRYFSWSKDVLQLRLEGMLIILATHRIWLKRAIFWGKIIVPENNTSFESCLW